MRWRIIIPILAGFIFIAENILYLGPLPFVISGSIELCLRGLGLSGLFIMFFVNLVAPFLLWSKYSFRSLIPLAVTILGIWLGFWILGRCSDYGLRRSVSFLESNIGVYEKLVRELSLPTPSESLCVETNSTEYARFFYLKGDMERFAPRGVYVHKKQGTIKDIQFLLKNFLGHRSGFMYSLDGDFRVRPDCMGWYWVPNNISNWCYFYRRFGTNLVGHGRTGALPLGSYNESDIGGGMSVTNEANDNR